MKVRVGKTDMARANGKELSSCVRRAGGSCGGDRKGDCSQNAGCLFTALPPCPVQSLTSAVVAHIHCLSTQRRVLDEPELHSDTLL